MLLSALPHTRLAERQVRVLLPELQAVHPDELAVKPKVCKDCEPGVKRPAPHPGPRCATHHRAVRMARREAQHARHVASTYGLRDGQYEQLYAAQGGVCYICRRAKGVVKKLAVDHDHLTGWVRGLLCSLSPCNKILGHLRDDAAMAMRIHDYLNDPPAFDVIGRVKPDE